MDDTIDRFDALLRSGAQRLTGHQRRLFQAEATVELCGGSPRLAERRFGWGRETVEKGLCESRHGLRCVEDFAARGRLRSEDKDPGLVAAVRCLTGEYPDGVRVPAKEMRIYEARLERSKTLPASDITIKPVTRKRQGN